MPRIAIIAGKSELSNPNKHIPMIKMPVAFLIPFLFLACNPTQKASVEPKKVQACMNQLLLEQQIPGINFSVILENDEQFDFSAGWADTLAQIPMTPEHVMFSASIGKTYAVGLLMQLVDEGKVQLNKRFLDYFPDAGWLNALPNMDTITVEMLLQHTSGLPRYINAQAVWDSAATSPDKVWSYRDRLHYLENAEPVHEAGKGWDYSDSNYLLIGMLIEQVTGEPYYELVESRLLDPLNLVQTHPSLRRDIPNLSNGYSKLDTFFRMPGTLVVDGQYAFNPQMEWTGGGMASTTADLARWAKLYYTADLFSDSLHLRIITPTLQGNNTGPNEQYGMGSFVYQTASGKAYGHTGFMPGYKSIFVWYPELEMAAALQINCDYATENLSLPEYLDYIMTCGGIIR